LKLSSDRNLYTANFDFALVLDNSTAGIVKQPVGIGQTTDKNGVGVFVAYPNRSVTTF
jgi:hypothetical protein